MTRRPSKPAWDGGRFRDWLEADGVSRRVAGNYVSRCRRVESNLDVNLLEATSTPDAFVQLMIEIHGHALQEAQSDRGKYFMTGSLRSAVRRFARFAHGKRVDNYPTSHGLSRYK